MSLTSPPLFLTRFVGRDQEVAAIRAILGETRLLTLTGSGGSGKTRLASEVASASPGAAWVELSPLHDPMLLPGAVLAALDMEQGSRPPMDALLDALRDRELLLVLDNCEHLVDACAHLAESLLHSCPRLSILATSREALGIRGERAWLVPGLSISGVVANTPEAIEGSEAVRLFVDRAQAAVAKFALTAANAAAIAHICRRLDGLPLAIELAAARVRSLPPEQLAARLDASFAVLSGGPRTAVPRHRTLRAAMQWSYDLLDPLERILLQRLSVFAGDFALEAAERVCAGTELAQEEILDVLAALVDKSLVAMREEHGVARYYLLETVRQFAHGLLEHAGGVADVAERHARTCFTLVSDAEPHFITRLRPLWAQRVQREIDNVRAALTFTRDHDIDLHVQLAGRLGWFWYSSGLWAEGRRWLEGAIALSAPRNAAADRARVLFGAGVLASLQAQAAVAQAWLEECVTLAQQLGDHRTTAYARAYIGVAYGQSGNPAALVPTEEARDWFRDAGDLYGLRLALVVLSTVHLVRGDLPLALTEAEEGAQIAREFGLDRELAIALQVLAAVVLTQGNLVRARDLFRESLAALRRDPSLFWIARALQLLGVVTSRLGEPLHGARLLGAAEACRETIGAGLLQHDRDRLLPVVQSAREAAGADAFDDAWSRGRAMRIDEALTVALGDRPAAGSTLPDASSSPPAAVPGTVLHALEVRALGPLEILVGGSPLPADAWRYTKPRELLLYLLCHPEGRTRDQIGLTFWPESSATQVKNSFHVTLHHLRKALGRIDLIAFDGDRYRAAWELGVWFDARVFEERAGPLIKTLKSPRNKAASPARSSARSPEPGEVAPLLDDLRAALSLYRGEFLVDERAGDWHLDDRDRFRRLFTEGMLILADQLETLDDFAEAADAYRRVIAAEELHEEAHRRLMRTLTRAGERGAALRQYERLSARLKADLDAEPEAETTALYSRLKRAEPV